MPDDEFCMGTSSINWVNFCNKTIVYRRWVRLYVDVFQQLSQNARVE